MKQETHHDDHENSDARRPRRYVIERWYRHGTGRRQLPYAWAERLLDRATARCVCPPDAGGFSPGPVRFVGREHADELRDTPWRAGAFRLRHPGEPRLNHEVRRERKRPVFAPAFFLYAPCHSPVVSWRRFCPLTSLHLWSWHEGNFQL